MFLGILALCFLLCGGLCFWRHGVLKKAEKETEWDGGGVFFFSVACFFLFILVIAALFSYSNQLGDLEDLKKIKANELIYQSRAEVLTKKFASYLAEAYPKHEREIFSKISPEKVSLYLVKYPELRASQTMITLVEQIGKLQDGYYEQRLKEQEILRNMRFRRVNPWFIPSIIPEIPPMQ
jgi:hypothetical protein